MTSLIDSTAHFESRLRELGVPQPFIDLVKTHGVRTLSQLAFAVGQPGQPLVDNNIDNFVQAAVGRNASIAEIAVLKRAAFEAQTFLVATLRQNVEKSDDVPRRIAFAERASRLQALQNAVVGVQISGEHEPAHCVLDKACHMFETNTLKYLEPAACVSRSLEIQGTTKSRELTFEKGSLVLKSGDDKLESPTDSEIKVHYAMVRRGLALQFARLMSHEQHCIWETYLFESIHREAPPGYHRPSLAQILQCDRAAWSRLSTVVGDLRQRADGTFPLGEALLNLRQDPNIALFLMPVARAPKDPAGGGGDKLRWSPYNPGKGSGGGGHKGPAKGKGKQRAPPVPAELRGKWFKTSSGDPLCFGFNCASGCSSKISAGERCPKGWHLCAEPRCQKAHSLQQHK